MLTSKARGECLVKVAVGRAYCLTKDAYQQGARLMSSKGGSRARGLSYKGLFVECGGR